MHRARTRDACHVTVLVSSSCACPTFCPMLYFYHRRSRATRDALASHAAATCRRPSFARMVSGAGPTDSININILHMPAMNILQCKNFCSSPRVQLPARGSSTCCCRAVSASPARIATSAVRTSPACSSDDKSLHININRFGTTVKLAAHRLSPYGVPH